MGEPRLMFTVKDIAEDLILTAKDSPTHTWDRELKCQWGVYMKLLKKYQMPRAEAEILLATILKSDGPLKYLNIKNKIQNDIERITKW